MITDDSRGIKAGNKMAYAIIELLHMMYNKKTAIRVLNSLIGQLEEKRKEFE